MLYKLSLSEIKNKKNIVEFIENKLRQPGKELLRWGVISVTNLISETSEIVIESQYSNNTNQVDRPEDKIQKLYSEKTIGSLVIPTGLGCSIGGFGGDANLAANLVASEFDYLIVNPNVVNGGAWQNIAQNMLYVEGFSFDQFMKGKIGLRPVKKNKIGVIFDKKIPEELMWRELQVIEAAKTIWGIDFIGHEITKEELKTKIEILEGNISSGSLENPEVLIEAAEKLKASGAEAIAIISYLEEELKLVEQNTNYIQGKGPDPIGGIEAIISHIIVSHCTLPCAHSPAFLTDNSYGYTNDKRVAPEIASYSFLPSVLKGLSQAPKLVKPHEMQIGDLSTHNLKSFIGPADCWGGSSFLSALENFQIQTYAIQSNKTGINLDPKTLGFNICTPRNYLELIGYLRADNLGIKIEPNTSFF